MNKIIKHKRILVALLTFCMFFSSFNMSSVYAVENDDLVSVTEEEPVDTAEEVEVDAVGEEPIELEAGAAEEETDDVIDGNTGEDTGEPDAANIPDTASEPDSASKTGEPVVVNIPSASSELDTVNSPSTASETMIGFSAGIYADADRTTLLSALTAEGAVLEGWEYLSGSSSSDNRYLGVVLSDLPMDGEQYQLVVEMEPILYINQNNDPALTNTTVTFSKNEALTVNTDGQYNTKTYSLDYLTYLIDSGTESLTLGLPLRFDVNLWNKQNGGQLGDGITPLLRVYLQEKQSDGTFATVTDCDVKLMTAAVSGSVPFAATANMHIVGGSDTATSNMGADDSLRLSFTRWSDTAYSGGHYDKDVELQITLPSCTVDGTKYTMEYQNFAFRTSGGTSHYDGSYDPDQGILTLKAENFYFNSHDLFQIEFDAPESIKSIPGNYVFKGSIRVVADGVTLERNVVINLDTNNQAILKTFSTSGSANVMELDTVQPFGNLAIQNDAAFENGSGPLEIALEFDSNDTNAVSVTTVNLMCDRDTETIDIYYTLVDRNGDPVYVDSGTGENQEFSMSVTNKHYSPGGTIKTSHYQTFTRADLPVEEHRQYYFKTLRYTMGNLPGNSKAYHSGASKAPYSAGTFWGYVNVDTVPPILPQHKLELYSVDTEGNKLSLGLTASAKTNIDTGATVPYGMEAASVSAASVDAGDSVTIGGRIFVAGYPYSSNNCLNEIRLGLVLPAGVTVNEASVSASYAGGSLKVSQVTCKSVSFNENLYIVEFEAGQKIGYYNERLSALDSGSTLAFSLQLNSEKAMSTQTIQLRECVFVAGLNRRNGSGGTYGDHAVVDTYDLNGNGLTDDNIGCFGNESTQSVSFLAPPAQLKITDGLSKADGFSGSSLTIDHFADIVNYNLQVQCIEGGSASEFYYIIPIGKTAMKKESNFVAGCQTDLELKDEVTVITDKGTAMKVLYTTTNVSDYNGALAVTDWSEDLPEGKTWEDVTMLKIVSADDTIVNGSVSTVSVPLGYAGEDTAYETMAGMQVQWSSRGYYSYQLGHNSNAATRSTGGCTITLTYTPQNPIEFTLTAAKKGEPQGEGAVNAYSFELPQFILAQEYRVKQITPYNVNLMDKDYRFETATSTEANENFRINISVKDSESESAGSVPVAIKKDNDLVGALGGNIAPEFTFTLENADALSDIVTDRYVTLTLISDHGVIVPVTITIRRELAAAEPTSPAIVAGELYAPFEGEDSAVVSSDSAFTAQFVTEYIPGNYTDHTITFDEAPAVNTTIMMIDWTDSDALKFYHYTLDGNTNTIKLTSFAGMGSSGSYVEPAATEMVTERLLFVVSFPESGESIRENTMTLTKKIKTGTDDTAPAVLKFTTVAKRSFTLEPQTQSVTTGEDFVLTYTSQCKVTDSRYTGRTLALVIGSGSGMPLPSEARLKVDGKNYYLSSQGVFVVPLKGVQVGDGSVTAAFYSETMVQASLKAELWASATANAENPLMGGLAAGQVNISVSAGKLPSFEVESMSKRLLHASDLSGTVTVHFEAKDAKTITVEIQKKTDADYVIQTTVLESVDGQTAADAGQGVFTVRSRDAVTLKLSAGSSVGTYRVLFRISNDSGTITVPFNFIIVE